MAKLNKDASKVKTFSLKDGLHHFTISKYKEFTTQKGVEGIHLGFDLIDQEENVGKASDLFYLTSDNQHKLMRVLEACGLESLWEKDEIVESDLLGHEGYCEISIIDNKNEKTKDSYPRIANVKHYYINGELDFEEDTELEKE